jgi:hypothetical protein
VYVSYNEDIIFAASSRKRLRGCLLSAVELECDKNGGLREVGAEAVFQEVADLAPLPLVDLGSLGRDSLEKSLQVNIVENSVADLGCLSRIPDPTFFPSRIRTVSIPDPGSSSKNLCILTPKKAKK